MMIGECIRMHHSPTIGDELHVILKCSPLCQMHYEGLVLWAVEEKAESSCISMLMANEKSSLFAHIFDDKKLVMSERWQVQVEFAIRSQRKRVHANRRPMDPFIKLYYCIN